MSKGERTRLKSKRATRTPPLPNVSLPETKELLNSLRSLPGEEAHFQPACWPTVSTAFCFRECTKATILKAALSKPV